MIALIDYGAGNLTSVRKALSALAADVFTPRIPGDLDGVRGIIVPGVGHFAATHALDDAWRAAIGTAVARDAALLGICLGMQWLFGGSDEAPDLPGFGVIAGRCLRFPTSPTGPGLKIPHVGWNSLQVVSHSTLMTDIAPDAQVYFTHSYVAPVVPETVATTTYGVPFSAAVECGRIAGVQFHPEKSGDAGLRILGNWLHAL